MIVRPLRVQPLANRPLRVRLLALDFSGGGIAFASSSVGVGAPWEKVVFTVTGNFAAGPTGDVNASRIQASGGGYVRANVTGLTPSTPYTVSWWVKNNGGTDNPFTKITGGPGDTGMVGASQYTAGAEWAQVTYNVTSNPSGDGSTAIFFYVAADQTGSADFLVADFQLVS